MMPSSASRSATALTDEPAGTVKRTSAPGSPPGSSWLRTNTRSPPATSRKMSGHRAQDDQHPAAPAGRRAQLLVLAVGGGSSSSSSQSLPGRRLLLVAVGPLVVGVDLVVRPVVAGLGGVGLGVVDTGVPGRRRRGRPRTRRRLARGGGSCRRDPSVGRGTGRGRRARTAAARRRPAGRRPAGGGGRRGRRRPAAGGRSRW